MLQSAIYSFCLSYSHHFAPKIRLRVVILQIPMLLSAHVAPVTGKSYAKHCSRIRCVFQTLDLSIHLCTIKAILMTCFCFISALLPSICFRSPISTIRNTSMLRMIKACLCSMWRVHPVEQRWRSSCWRVVPTPLSKAGLAISPLTW